MTAKLNLYEVLASYTESVRIIIEAESPQAAAARVVAGEWGYDQTFDITTSDVEVCDVKARTNGRVALRKVKPKPEAEQ